ncbi:monovalent cation/H(+) antiporter subunit G [Marinospirillum sp.]|uniref:cation:proton antiporter n=1 Tax=Marinospirillum sp. TaxID=2183934 RepID=UPI002870634F|nr:monovalent cation/H(+) antiporter subunit G [Marinospirillum sp.]MDR9467486.1 monovalent cation/H(+) antiporter subunit G [Marinospirillum sp.]
MLLDTLRSLLLLSGAFFYLVGTLGLLRFPDAATRIHALTKVDNLGLGLIVLGLLPGAGSWPVALKMILIWLLAIAAASLAGHLVIQAWNRVRETQAEQKND